MDSTSLKADSAPMSAAPFVWRPDGRPDWRVMWTDFCELALFGGPPHRGPDNPLRAVSAPDSPADIGGMVAEIQRGIWETTGLESDLAGPGWLAIPCESTRMAAWMCTAIILENVDARCADDRLLIPASERFTVENEVKSVITVVAKIHHYWVEHVDWAR
jgi:sirohydrochlorin cobaltochelatase